MYKMVNTLLKNSRVGKLLDNKTSGYSGSHFMPMWNNRCTLVVLKSLTLIL